MVLNDDTIVDFGKEISLMEEEVGLMKELDLW